MRAKVLFLFCLLYGGVAFADMVPPMPEMKCDLGARWGTDHGGGGCYPTTCSKSEDCGKGETCQLQGLCISFETKYGRPNGTPYIESSAYGTCDSKKACTSGQCEVVKRCVPKGTKATPGPENKLTPPDPFRPEDRLPPDPVTKDPEPQPQPKIPETQPDPQPDSQPDATPENTPTKVPPPTKVDKGRCSVSPVGDFSLLWMPLLMFFSVLLLRRKR
jgi:hypothetical protein